MIIAVFGGNGFIGSRLVLRLLSLGHRVRVFDRNMFSHEVPDHQGQLELFNGDFSSGADFSEVLHGCQAVFHLISTTLPSASNANPVADVAGNLIPTLHLLDQMKAMGVTRLIFPSSGGTVYGEADQLPIDETHPTNPIVSYGATKLAIEKFLAVYKHNFSLSPVCLRISNPYGPGFRSGSPQGVIGAFLNSALREQPIELWGAGDVQRDYLYIEDLIDAMVCAMTYQGNHVVFNISTGIGTSLLEIIDLIETVTGKSIDLKRFPARAFDVKSNILSNDLAASALGWRPVTPLHLGIELTAKWLQITNLET